MQQRGGSGSGGALALAAAAAVGCVLEGLVLGGVRWGGDCTLASGDDDDDDGDGDDDEGVS